MIVKENPMTCSQKSYLSFSGTEDMLQLLLSCMIIPQEEGGSSRRLPEVCSAVLPRNWQPGIFLSEQVRRNII